MACNIENLLRNKLVEDNIINKSNEILDREEFDRLNRMLTEHSVDKYGIILYDQSLFEITERDGKEYINTNPAIFEVLDDLIQDYKYEFTSQSETEGSPTSTLLNLVTEEGESLFYSEEFNSEDSIIMDNTSNNSTYLFGKENKREGTALETLDHLLTDKNISEEVKELGDNLRKVFARSKTTVEVVKDSKMKDKDALMEISIKDNSIRIPESTMRDYSNQDILVGILHELAHDGTYNSYMRAESISEKAFKKTIDDIYSKYLELSEGSDSYGFTSPLEFIAEVFTNTEFQNELRDLEYSNRSLWNRIIDAVRRLFGMRKTSEIDNLINTITESINLNDFEGTTGRENVYLSKKESKKAKEESKTKEKINYYKLRTLKSRLEHTVNSAMDQMDNQLKLYDYLIKRSENPEEIESIANELIKLKNSMERSNKVNRMKSVVDFVTHMNSSIINLQRRLNEFDLSSEEAEKTLNAFISQANSFTVMEDINRFISDAKVDPKSSEFISIDELNALSTSVTESMGVFNSINTDISEYLKQFFIELADNRHYQTEVIHEWRERLRKEYGENPDPTMNETEWINYQLNGPLKEQVDADVRDAALDLAYDPIFDITSFTREAVSAINTNNKLIKIVKNVVNTMRKSIIDRSIDLDYELKPLFDEYLKHKKHSDPQKAFKELFVEREDGVYLKGDYDFKLLDEYEKAKGSKTQTDKFFKDNFDRVPRKDGSGKFNYFPKDKWKSKEITGINGKIREKAQEIFLRTNKETFGQNSLVTHIGQAKFIKLPAVYKQTMERTLQGDIKGAARDKWDNLKRIREDDIGYDTDIFDRSNEPIRKVRVHFRGKVSARDQSYDIFSLMRLEGLNGINFSEKLKAENNATIIKEIARHKDYYDGRDGNLIKNFFNSRNEYVTSKLGKDSNTYKRIRGMIETNIYDIFHHNMGTALGMDVNKMVSYLNGYTALLGMGFNEVSATTNVLNGNTQIFLESIAGNFISRKSLRKATKIYTGDMLNMVKDSTSPIKTSFVNQINEIFDVWGEKALSQDLEFFRKGFFKTFSRLGSSTLLQTTGEHWLQSVVGMSVLGNIKVMNADSNFINKEGKVVKNEKDAATLLDMYKPGKNGRLKLDENVAFTTHAPGLHINKGGRELITELIKKKLFDTVGNYDKNMQPEISKKAYGQLLLMFRKYLIPMGIARYRGFRDVLKETKDIPEHRKFFSEALQEYEIGSHTQAARVIVNAVRHIIRGEFSQIAENWNSMSQFEKIQAKKGLAELTMALVVLPVLSMTAFSFASDDEDNDFKWFMALQAKRLLTEVRSFVNPSDQWRTIKSPIVSLNVVENGIEVMYNIFSPWNWDERVQSGKHKGRRKVSRSFDRITPFINSHSTPYREKVKYLHFRANN